MSIVDIEDLHIDVRPHFWSQRRQILQGVSLRVEAGEIFGFLGPNGAGKTTTIKALLGLWRFRRGAVRLFGEPVGRAEARRRVGFMPERAYFPEHVSGRELVTQHARLSGLPRAAANRRADEILLEVGLGDAHNQRLGAYSKGMLQRVGLAQALIADPKLVVLDEPMSGLDPIGRRDIRAILLSLREAGKTVFFSTHILPDVEMICDRVGILVRGAVRKVGPLNELLGDSVERVEVTAGGIDPSLLASARTLAETYRERGGAHVFGVASISAANLLVDRLRASGATLREVQALRPTLEDIFVDETRTSGENL